MERVLNERTTNEYMSDSSGICCNWISASESLRMFKTVMRRRVPCVPHISHGLMHMEAQNYCPTVRPTRDRWAGLPIDIPTYRPVLRRLNHITTNWVIWISHPLLSRSRWPRNHHESLILLRNKDRSEKLFSVKLLRSILEICRHFRTSWILEKRCTEV